MSIERISADQGAAQIQFGQEIFESGDFVGFGRDFDLATDDAGLSVQGAEELDGLAVDFGGGAEAFAIDGQGGEAQILEMGAQPAIDDAVQLRRIQALQHPADGAFAGGQEFAGLAAAAGAQAAEVVLMEGLSKVADVQEVVVAGNHGGGGDGHDGGDLAMPPAFVATRIVQGCQSLKEALGLLTTQGIFVGMGGAFKGCPVGWQDWGGEDLARLGNQRIEEEGFRFGVELIEVDAGATEAFGDADFDPVGRAITSAFEAFWIDEGFDQGDGMTVTLQPILAEAGQVQAQDLRS